MILSCCLMSPVVTRAAIINVVNGDNLQAKIDAAAGGDTLLLGSGVYGGFKFSDRHFTQDKPLIIKAAPNATPVIRGASYKQAYLAHISKSSYVVLDGLTFETCNQPVYCTDVDHLILVNLEVRDGGQEMIHIRGTSRTVDIINCKIHDTGHTLPQWSEGIYIGSGGKPFMNEEYIWIEGNEIYNTGNSEAINIKSQCFHITIRGNKVHDIPPGTATQHNEAAISCEAADLSFKPGVDPDIWIENNEVYNIRFGRWANAIKASTAGGKIVNNKIHDCEQYGIEFNAHMNGPGVFTTWLHGNMIANCKAGAINTTILPTKNEDPGPNPNRPQTWYVSSR
ncbi:MAG: right-handed parallel beta-helix repeat-containing protein [Opitutaceae bacterium]